MSLEFSAQVSVCVWCCDVFVITCDHMYPYVYMWRSEVDIGCSPLSFSTLLWGHGLCVSVYICVPEEQRTCHHILLSRGLSLSLELG